MKISMLLSSAAACLVVATSIGTSSANEVVTSSAIRSLRKKHKRGKGQKKSGHRHHHHKGQKGKRGEHKGKKGHKGHRKGHKGQKKKDSNGSGKGIQKQVRREFRSALKSASYSVALFDMLENRCAQQRNDTAVACKLQQPESSNDPDGSQSSLMEAMAAGVEGHP